MKIHTLTIEHQHGRDVTAHASHAAAHILSPSPATMPRAALVYRFACYDDAGRANYIAGQCIDALADATGESFWYEVTPLPYVASITSPHEVARAAVEAVTN